MAEAYRDKEAMEYTVMDATNMEYLPNGCFDAIIDKALLDSILCSKDCFDKCSKMLDEMYRVLKPGGTYIVVSHGKPLTREAHLKKVGDWSVRHEVIRKVPVDGFDTQDDDLHHYVYFCTKPAIRVRTGN